MLRRTLAAALCAGASITVMGATARAQTGPVAKDAEAIPEVVVTSQRRTQNLQDVPISVSAFGADFIKQTGAQNMGELQQFTPGLTIDNTSTTQPNYTIRGISGSTFGIGTEPSVGVYVDGVYSARSGESLVFFNDVEHVEVLKGPQGTLFGRNTSAGAISITTNKPSDHTEAMLDVKLGNFAKREVTLMFNQPLSDTLDVRFDGILNRRDGFIPNLSGGKATDDENNQSTRLALRWRPDSQTDIVLSWDHDHTDNTPPTAIGVGPFANYSGNPFAGGYNDELNGQETRRLDSITLNAVRRFGEIALTSLTNYHSFRTTNRESETGTNTNALYFDTENLESNHNFYQEFRLNGVHGPLTWLAGASYYQEHAEQTTNATGMTDSIDTTLKAVGVPGVCPDGAEIFDCLNEYGVPTLGLPWLEAMNNVGRYQAYSLFGDATWTVTSQLHLTAGVRFTDDQKKFQWEAPPVEIIGGSAVTIPDPIATAFGVPAGIDLQTFAQNAIGNIIFSTAPLPQGSTLSRNASWTNVSPRFVIDYRFSPDLMAFASASFGYKAGGFNSSAVNSVFAPEKVQSFEGGIKSDWLDHRFRANVSAYYYRYSNQQSLNQVNIPGELVPEYITQTGDSEAKGVDVELIARPVHALTLTLNAGYINSTWTKDTLGEQGDDGTTHNFDLKGQPTGEPELRAVFGLDYTRDLGEFGALRLHADHSFTSAERFNDATNFEQTQYQLAGLVDFAHIPNYRQSRNLTNARLTWEDKDGHLQISLYGENLFDNHYVTDPGGLAVFTLDAPMVRPADPPRFYGVEVVWRL